jgi:SagB-type dehydrogenase family enzyme
MERRDFMKKGFALGVGFLAVTKGIKAWAKGLPSDPDAARGAAAGPDVILLPSFEKNSNFALDQALLGRKSSRSYDGQRQLTREELSRLLWAATGVNRPDGHRTVASARGKYPVDLLAAIPEGVYRYEPKDHKLVRLIAQDIRDKIPAQDPYKKAAMNVLFVINKDKVADDRIYYADIEIGFMGQGLYLESVALGLGSIMYAGVQTENVTKLLGLKENQILRIAQSVGPTK